MNLWGPAMFGVVLMMIFSGYPVAFALGGTALIFAGLASLFDLFPLPLLFALPERTFGTMSNQVLLAVPFFIFMGTVLEKSKLAEQLLETIGVLFGRFRGGLAIGVVFVGALLAAATGVVGASVTAMGLISLPVMQRNGYDEKLSLGVIAASGTLGQIIPPSIVLIVLGDQMGVSVGDLFRAALVPGLILTGGYAVYIAGLAIVNKTVAPALPESMRLKGFELLKRVVLSLLPPLALIVVVLGSIFAGVATPTEAGALGAVGAMVLAALNRQLSMKALNAAMEETSRLTIMVVFLLIGSTAFALVFRGLDGDLWIEGLLTGIPGGALGFLIVVNVVVFLLGFFIDFFEIAFIIVPLIVPAALALGVDLTWLGIVLAVNLQTSFLTPPFGFSLFYLRGVTPSTISTQSIYRGVIPFIVIQVVVLAGVVWMAVPK
ncbi:MAG: TRAP transporter large permease subunit [Gemmatimonadales bacterium]|jgi:tripartite ATP-independent transporter DctM subunit|nr:TRAP transporter large permease subunit [Gemmatimonadales bacterium]MDG2239343.1 TRAP transporter large permease subunit [Longimicrobiales bacterium]MBT3773729.1 TRAP transporter large permease subunit [Gemmatimonadales bacterium]MBT3957697.1 TRAP transporter large permease subunit [Gemmatimonadales bacterium]MBT4187496.1 TRAP transporter large permease subunit [Gemmatimonadales bacterium]